MNFPSTLCDKKSPSVFCLFKPVLSTQSGRPHQRWRNWELGRPQHNIQVQPFLNGWGLLVPLLHSTPSFPVLVSVTLSLSHIYPYHFSVNGVSRLTYFNVWRGSPPGRRTNLQRWFSLFPCQVATRPSPPLVKRHFSNCGSRFNKRFLRLSTTPIVM